MVAEGQFLPLPMSDGRLMELIFTILMHYYQFCALLLERPEKNKGETSYVLLAYELFQRWFVQRSQLQLRSAGLRALSALVCILVFRGFLFSYWKPSNILLFFIPRCSIICLETHDVITVASLHHGADLVHGRTFIHSIYI